MIEKRKSGISRLWAMITLLSIEMVVALVLFFIALLIFLYLVKRVFYLKNNSFDQQVFDALEPFVSNTTNGVMQVITFLGTHLFLIPANLALIAWFLFVKKQKWYSIKIPAIALSSLLLMFVLKQSFGRERPLIPLLESASGLSFPSGHALMSVTFYGLMSYISWQTIKNVTLKWMAIILCGLLIVVIGFSRIYLRVHYTSDVIAGYCMGIVWLFISLNILRRMEKYSKVKVEESNDNLKLKT